MYVGILMHVWLPLATLHCSVMLLHIMVFFIVKNMQLHYFTILSGYVYKLLAKLLTYPICYASVLIDFVIIFIVQSKQSNYIQLSPITIYT